MIDIESDSDFEKRMENDELPKKNRTIKFADILENHKVHTFYWDNREIETSAEFLEASYYAECQLNNTRPLSHVVQQIQEKSKDLTLKGEKLDLPQVDSLEIIFKLTKFRTINIENSFINQDAAAAVFDMLLHYESCENVNFGFNRTLGTRSWTSVAQFVKRSTRVNLVDAHSTQIPDASLAPFSRALRSSIFLRCLRLENCSLSGRPIALLTAGMRQNNSIQELYLADNRLSPEDGAHLRVLISLSNTLSLLDLRNNNLQDIGLSHLCEGLKTAKCNLSTLVLWNNKISTRSINSLAEALVKNQKLQTLNLGQNAIQENGASILKQGLQNNTSVTRLGLVGCRLTEQGTIAVAEFLAESTIVERLDLRNNDIGLGGLMALSLAARENKSLTRLDLDKPPRDSTLPPELIERQNQLWDNLIIYSERNKKRLDINQNDIASKSDDSESNLESPNQKTRKEIEFHYAEEPDRLLSPKLLDLDLKQESDDSSPQNDSPASGDKTVENSTGKMTGNETTEVKSSEPISIHQSKNPNRSPLTPNSAIKAIDVVQSFQEKSLS